MLFLFKMKKDKVEYFYSDNMIKYKVINGKTDGYYDKGEYIKLNFPEKFYSK